MSAPVNRSGGDDRYACDNDDDRDGNGGGRNHDDQDRDDYDDAEFVISSDDPCVAATTITCRRCHRPFEAICIYCRTGTSFGEPLENFTVANIYAMDTILADSLSAWPHFHPVGSPEEPGHFTNHCPSCGAPYEDDLLHDESEDPFFDIAHAAPGRIRLTPLSGQIQLSGDEHYLIDRCLGSREVARAARTTINSRGMYEYFASRSESLSGPGGWGFLDADRPR